MKLHTTDGVSTRGEGQGIGRESRVAVFCTWYSVFSTPPYLVRLVLFKREKKRRLSCEIEKFVEAHLCKLRVIQLLTNIGLLRGPERHPLFSLSTPSSRHSPLRTAERARMPETALLSAFIFFFAFKFQRFFFWELKICSP